MELKNQLLCTRTVCVCVRVCARVHLCVLLWLWITATSIYGSLYSSGLFTLIRTWSSYESRRVCVCVSVCWSICRERNPFTHTTTTPLTNRITRCFSQKHFISSLELWFLPLKESFIRGEEDEAEEEEEEDEDELWVMLLEEAWAAARPSRRRELQVTIMAAIIIIMVIMFAHEKQSPSSQGGKFESDANLLWFLVRLLPIFGIHLAVSLWTDFDLAQPWKPRRDSLATALVSFSSPALKLVSVIFENVFLVFLEFSWQKQCSSCEGWPSLPLTSETGQKRHTRGRET